MYNVKMNLKELTTDQFYEKLKRIIIDSKKHLYEAQVLRSLYDISISDLKSIELYQYHFALFHLLYKLQEYFRFENKYLNVHFMKIYLVNYPEISKCRFLDKNYGVFCNEDAEKGNSYCNFHQTKIDETALENQSIKYFYLCEDNYNSLDEKNAEAFISGAWELLFNYNEFKNALMILNLPENCTIEMVKTSYRNLAKKFHPDLNHDLNGENSSINEEFFKINNAYQFLLKVLPKFLSNSFTK